MTKTTLKKLYNMLNIDITKLKTIPKYRIEEILKIFKISSISKKYFLLFQKIFSQQNLKLGQIFRPITLQDAGSIYYRWEKYSFQYGVLPALPEKNFFQEWETIKEVYHLFRIQNGLAFLNLITHKKEKKDNRTIETINNLWKQNLAVDMSKNIFLIKNNEGDIVDFVGKGRIAFNYHSGLKKTIKINKKINFNRLIFLLISSQVSIVTENDEVDFL